MLAATHVVAICRLFSFQGRFWVAFSAYRSWDQRVYIYIYIYIYIVVYIFIHVCIYIYIYVYRKRDTYITIIIIVIDIIVIIRFACAHTPNPQSSNLELSGVATQASHVWGLDFPRTREKTQISSTLDSLMWRLLRGLAIKCATNLLGRISVYDFDPTYRRMGARIRKRKSLRVEI